MNVRTLTSNYKHNVVYTTPEKLSKAKRQLLAASKGGNNQQRHSHRLLSASPLITSQRPTNFSTITEEEEQQCAKPATGNYTLHRQRVYISQTIAILVGLLLAGIPNYGHISEQPTSNGSDAEALPANANIPIITLDPNSLP